MSVPPITTIWLAQATARRPLLVVGPSLGTAAVPLWGQCAGLLAERFDVLGWELPGHGSGGAVSEAFTVADLARGVIGAVDRVLAERGEPGAAFVYAGDSVGGAVGVQLLLDQPRRIAAATLLCTGARIGDARSWRDRAELVRRQGTEAVVEVSLRRWFAPGFVDRQPAVADALLNTLRDADPHCYAWVCEALAAFDVRDRLAEITVPVTAVAGAHDEVTTVSDLRLIADGVADGWLVVLDEAAHLAAIEAPATVCSLIARPPEGTQVATTGMAVRRAVLGDAHVDRASAATTDFTRDFQTFITQYAWGSVWTRPGLDRRSRSLITLTALVAGGHHEELAMHVRGARTNGLTADEIKECLLQTAVYCGVPAANTAFRIAARVLDELIEEPT